MHLIAPLVAGIVGAPNGTVELYRRGTSNRATWWASFEADAANSSGDDVVLDGNGSAVVYVGEVVDIVVRDITGASVREWTDGSASGSVELISVAATGADYETAAIGTNEPTTVQAWADSWFASAGAADFKVLLNGVATLLQDAVVGSQFYNVKDTRYGGGAKGDGTTDDTAAIQAAMDAARDAGGGIVFFPGSTYRITTALTWDRKVSMLGVGSTHSVITMDHATARICVGSGAVSSSATFVQGLTFGHAQANTGKIFDLTVDARNHIFIGCVIGNGGNSRGIAIDDTGQHTELVLLGCRFGGRAAMILVDNVKAYGCKFVPAAWNAAGTVVLCTGTDQCVFTDCEFFPGDITASTVTCVASGANSTGRVQGCTFNNFGATTTGICIAQGAGSEMSVTGCEFGALASATAATAMSLATGAAFAEYGNVWHSTSALLPSMTPYAYTTSTAGEAQALASRDAFRGAATQTGGGTQTLNSNLYGHIQLTVTDNTAFTLNLNLAPVGAMFTVDIFASGGAGTGAINWGANVYGNPAGGFTIATTLHRCYQFRSELVGAAHVWLITMAYGVSL